MKKIKGILTLVRPDEGLVAGMSTLVGMFIGSNRSISLTSLLAVKVFATMFVLTSFAMTINDYYDYEIDKINAPHRPLPSGLITPEEDIVLTICLAVIAIVLAALTNPQCLTISILVLIVSFLYSAAGKKTGLLGNMMVSFCMAITFIYGAFAISGEITSVIIFSGIAFFVNTGREIIKGIPDVVGDKKSNIKTLAALYGAEKAAKTAASFCALAIVLSLLPLIYSSISNVWFYSLVLLADLGFSYSSWSIMMNPTPKNALSVKTYLLISMAIALIGLFGS